MKILGYASIIVAALSLLIGIILVLAGAQFFFGLTSGSFLKFTEVSLLFGIAFLLLQVIQEKGK